MMSQRQIIELSDQEAKKAARQRKFPFIVWPGDVEKMPPFPFPNIGSYRPKGWTLVDHFQASKQGEDDGFSLGLEEVKQRLRVDFGYAIIEEGQFQLVIGEFKQEK